MTFTSLPTAKDSGRRSRDWAIRHLPAIALGISCLPLVFGWRSYLSVQGRYSEFFPFAIPSLSTPNPYKDAVSAYMGNRTFDSWALLCVASIAILVALFRKRLRYPAVALALIASIVAVASAPGDRAVFERLVQAPHDPQLALLEQFPAPETWRSGPLTLQTEEYPSIRKWFYADESQSHEEVCEQLDSLIAQWAGRDIPEDASSSDSCVFNFDLSDSTVRARALGAYGETYDAIGIDVTAKDPVKVEDFL